MLVIVKNKTKSRTDTVRTSIILQKNAVITLVVGFFSFCVLGERVSRYANIYKRERKKKAARKCLRSFNAPSHSIKQTEGMYSEKNKK